MLKLPIHISTPMRLDRWLKSQFPSINQALIERWLRKGTLRLNGKKAESKTRVKQGDEVWAPDEINNIKPPIRAKKPTIKKIITQEEEAFLTSLILWEDDDLLVLNKPSGLAVQGGTRTKEHLDGLLQAWGRKTKTTYRLVHRLDRDTSGVLLVAKTVIMAAHLTALFRSHRVKKVYWAFVVGQPEEAYGEIKAPLRKGVKSLKEKMLVDPKGLRAHTFFRQIRRFAKKGLTWMEFIPLTGRTHQIRAHSAYMGCPVLGDGKYGGATAVRQTRQLFLHARQITIEDLSGDKLTFAAAPPPHFEEIFRSEHVAWQQYE